MKSLIQQIHADQTRAGEAIQPPADPIQIALAKTSIAALFNATLSGSYCDFLALANGIDFNGLVLYGASQSNEAVGPGGFWQGLIAANQAWRESPGIDDLLILGDTDMEMFCTRLDGTAPGLRDKVGGDIVETFPTVAAALEVLLRSRL